MTSPTSAYRVDTRTGEVESLADLVPVAEVEVPEPVIMVQRRRATVADGTAVPYFLITPAGWSGAGPVLIWGYGGFKIPIFADYRPGWTGWLAAGGALVIANLRGGGSSARTGTTPAGWTGSRTCSTTRSPWRRT